MPMEAVRRVAEFTLHFGGLFTVTISPPLEIMSVDKGRLLLALDVNSDCMGLLLNEFALTVNVEGSKILATVCFFSSSQKSFLICSFTQRASQTTKDYVF